MDEYRNLKYKKIYLAYTHFVSGLYTKTVYKTIASNFQRRNKRSYRKNHAERTFAKKIDYLFEGDFNTLIETLAEKIIRMQIYQMILGIKCFGTIGSNDGDEKCVRCFERDD